MLLQSYKDEELMWLTTCFGDTGDDMTAFRGDLVIIHGELKAVSGKRNLPIAQIKQAVILEEGEKLKLVAGNMASVEELTAFIEKYHEVLDPSAVVIFYIDNLGDNVSIDVEGIAYHLYKFTGGIVWNELMDEAYLDKEDFKGQKAEQKIATMFDALKTYESKNPVSTIEEVLATKTDEVREAWGAI